MTLILQNSLIESSDAESFTLIDKTDWTDKVIATAEMRISGQHFENDIVIDMMNTNYSPGVTYWAAYKETSGLVIYAINPLIAYPQVKSAILATPPENPDDGDKYIIPIGATDAWSNNQGDFATWDVNSNEWVFTSATEGDKYLSLSDGKIYHYTAALWVLTTETALFPNGTFPDGFYQVIILVTGTDDEVAIPADEQSYINSQGFLAYARQAARQLPILTYPGRLDYKKNEDAYSINMYLDSAEFAGEVNRPAQFAEIMDWVNKMFNLYNISY